MIKSLHNFTYHLLDLLFPPVCCLCKIKTPIIDHLVCEDCWARVNIINNPICMKCGLPILSYYQRPDHRYYLCYRCRKRRWAFDQARSAFIFNDSIKDAIHLMKYSGHFRMSGFLGREMVKVLVNNFSAHKTLKEAIIVPVPITNQKLKEREFNQSELLANTIGNLLGLPIYTHLLERTKEVKPQVGLPLKERERNVRGAFKVTNPQFLKNRRILLLDDVMTTGATVNECSKQLRRAGGKNIYVWTLASAMRI